MSNIITLFIFFLLLNGFDNNLFSSRTLTGTLKPVLLDKIYGPENVTREILCASKKCVDIILFFFYCNYIVPIFASIIYNFVSASRLIRRCKLT